MTADRQQARVSAAAVFCGSCLLFLIQPLLGRTLLPIFGGSAAVWTVCLAAYQLLLLAGYAYAHGIARRSPQVQRTIHLTLLCGASIWAVAFAALRPVLRAAAGNSGQPALEVLLCVLACAGVPYVALAAGATVVQGWLAVRSGDGAGAGAASTSDGSVSSVYRLYAVSNLGSFIGLLIYPFVLEPFVSLSVQWWAVAIGLCGYTALMMRLGRAMQTDCGDRMVDVAGPDGPPFQRQVQVWAWYVLPGASAFLLNAIIAHLFTDVTPLPLVWVLMLAAFLLSYVTGFSARRWLTSSVGIVLAIVSLGAAAVAHGMWGTGSFLPNATASLGVLFFGGSVLHGWLYEERPETARLSRYYLAIAAGGAMGGLLASLVAPYLFSRVTEYPLALSLCVLLLALRVPWPRRLNRLSGAVRPLFAVGCVAMWLMLFGALSRHTTSRTLFQARNFYGAVRVTQTLESFGQAGVLPVHYLWCGQTTHGLQVRSPLFAGRGTSYYGATGGGIAFSSHPACREGRGVKVGVVGLGAGCLACYGRPQDLFRFYEINPLMIRVAGAPNLFSFLNDAPMRIDLVPGDARKMLEREQAAGDPLYDILMIDAYSGDAVPYHLATLEAFRLYFERIEEDGILAVHVSNWHVDLLPLCKAVAKALGVHPYGVVGVAENSVTTDAMWVFMTRRPHRYDFPGKSSAREVVWERVRDISVPTDEKGSLLPLLRH
ncbi:MAG TPA: hypothetical protein P5026_03730 [Kiritimatiellia bacterium]|nr:hypothetical protein [Kiritimatiellia bacterium]HRU70142.1 hypothetical protein [Kiritimatiellia bacterium]